MTAPDTMLDAREVFAVGRYCLTSDETALACPVCDYTCHAGELPLPDIANMHTHLTTHTPAEWLRAIGRARTRAR